MQQGESRETIEPGARPRPSALVVALLATVVTCGLWIALAWRTPTSTYHFAPLIAAGIGPYLVKRSGGRRQLKIAVGLVASCAALVGAAIALLAAQDLLRGPTFWSNDGAAFEAVIFTAVGALLGLSVLASRLPPAPRS